MLSGNCAVCVQHADSASIIGHLGEVSLLSDATCIVGTAPSVCNARALHRSSAILVRTNRSFQRHMFCGKCPVCVQHADSASIIGHLGEDESFFPTTRVLRQVPRVCNTRTLHRSSAILVRSRYFSTPHVLRQLRRVCATRGLCIDHRPSG